MYMPDRTQPDSCTHNPYCPHRPSPQHNLSVMDHDTSLHRPRSYQDQSFSHSRLPLPHNTLMNLQRYGSHLHIIDTVYSSPHQESLLADDMVSSSVREDEQSLDTIP